MPAVVSRQGLVVPKRELTGDQLRLVRAELRVRADWDPATSHGCRPEAFTVYAEDGQSVCLPVHWAQERLPGVAARSRFTVEPVEMRFAGTLNAALGQPAAAAACMRAMRETGGGVLSLYTGAGKTCVSLYVACELRVKTLVVVNTAVLMEQWRERIQHFVPGVTVGRIQGPVADTAGHAFVVAMLQSLARRPYDVSGFGLSIVDECVHIGAPAFSQAMLRINCPYRLGLSATPNRADGLTRVITWFLGPIFLTVERENQDRVRVEVVPFTCAAYSQPPPISFGKVNFGRVLQTLCEQPERNRLLADVIRALPRDRKVLVLSDRREHCKELARRLAPAAQPYLGGMRRAELDAASKAQVIVATFCLAAEGLDIPALNTLVLATPKKNVVQACGRIMRGVLTGHPLIVDVRDAWPCTLGQHRARLAYYARAGYTVGAPEAAEPVTAPCAGWRGRPASLATSSAGSSPCGATPACGSSPS